MKTNTLQGKTMLIAGGSGFIGTNLSIYLKNQGAKIINISRHPSPVGLKTHVLDLAETEKISEILKDQNIDYLMYLAGYSSPGKSPNEEETYHNNVRVTENFLNLFKEKNLKGVMYASTGLVYDSTAPMPLVESSPVNPKHFYAKTKLEAERIFQVFSEETTIPYGITRVSNAYGPYQWWEKNPLLIAQVISQALLEKKIEVRSVTPIRDFVYVEDVVKAFVLLLENGCSGVFNVSTGKGKSIKDIVTYVSKRLNVPVVVKETTTVPDRFILDNMKIREATGWEPLVDLEEGLEKTIEYFQGVVK